MSHRLRRLRKILDMFSGFIISQKCHCGIGSAANFADELAVFPKLLSWIWGPFRDGTGGKKQKSGEGKDRGKGGLVGNENG